MKGTLLSQNTCTACSQKKREHYKQKIFTYRKKFKKKLTLDLAYSLSISYTITYTRHERKKKKKERKQERTQSRAGAIYNATHKLCIHIKKKSGDQEGREAMWWALYPAENIFSVSLYHHFSPRSREVCLSDRGSDHGE